MNKNIIAAAAGVTAGVAIFFAREKIKALRAANELEEDILEPIESTEEPEPEHDEEIVVHKPVDDVIDLDKAVTDAQAMMDEKNSPRPVKKVNRKVEAATDEPGWTYPDEETYFAHDDIPGMNLSCFINDDMILDENDLPITDFVESLIGDLCEVAKEDGDRGFCINHKKGLRFSMDIIREPIADYMREKHDYLEGDEDEEDEVEDE
jgi:hypothetical protein